MAKAFGQPAAASQGMMTRPMPRPDGLGGAVQRPAAPAQGGGFMSGMLGPQGSQARYEMAMGLLKSAMSGAAGSGSPALAFLTPIIGAMTGVKLENQRAAAMGAESNDMVTGLLGGPLSPEAQRALAVLQNPDAPDFLKDIARTMFKGAVPIDKAAPRRSGGGGRSSGGGGSRAAAAAARPPKLTYLSRDPDGVVRGYNPATGKREPVPTADAVAAASPAAAAPGAAPATPLAMPSLPASPAIPADPALPAGPGKLSDDDLLKLY